MSKDRATIGKYEIVQRIGTGGFGAVYEARDPFIKRTVAVKTCLVPDKEDQERFFREAELAGRLHHRNVTTVHDFGVHDGMPYLVEEFLSGDDLDLVIRREDPLGLARRIEILIGVAYGLEHAHNAGIVHRDIKPSNIRLLEDGTVKIMDFGIASSLHPEGKPAGGGTALGTSAYLAPERIRGHAADRRADIFSFGVLAYELLTYRKPFGGETVSDTLDCILKREPEPLARLAPEVPASLAAVVNRALEKDPGSRYASIGELRDDLIAVHRDLGHRALLVTAPRPAPASPDIFGDSPMSPSIRIARGSRLTLRTAAAAALVFVAIAGGVIVLWPAKDKDTKDLSAVATRTEAPVPKASATAPSPGEREFEPAPDVAPKTLSAGAVVPVPAPAPKARPLIRISRGAESRRASSGVESENAEISHSASGSPSGRHHAERYARAAEEPGLSRETRAHLHLRSAMAYYEAGDPRRAERSLELAFALSPELEVGAGSYGAGFARLAHKARSEAP